MKNLIVLLVLVAIALPAAAVDGKEVAYVGGTAPNLKAGTIGKLDTTQQNALVFDHQGGKLSIPFANMRVFEYRVERARRLGVLVVAATGLFKRMQRQHFVRISYMDDSGAAGSVVFELSKEVPRALLAVLEARAPQACKPSPHNKCYRN